MERPIERLDMEVFCVTSLKIFVKNSDDRFNYLALSRWYITHNCASNLESCQCAAVSMFICYTFQNSETRSIVGGRGVDKILLNCAINNDIACGMTLKMFTRTQLIVVSLLNCGHAVNDCNKMYDLCSNHDKQIG
jgi:hypothetical protein